MSDDIIARLRCSYADPPCEACTSCAARAEIERLREQVEYRDDVIAMLRADVARLGSFLHPIGEEARRG